MASRKTSSTSTWLTWIEQGRTSAISVPTLAAIARGLKLSRAERQYLFQLAARAEAIVRLQPLADDRFLTQRTLDEAMVLKLELENLPFVEEGERLTETGSLFEDKPLFEAEDDEQKFEPQILILPGGEMTPFRISLLHQDLELEWWLEGNELGELRLLPPGVEADDDPNVPFDNTSPGMSERERAQRAAAEAER